VGYQSETQLRLRHAGRVVRCAHMLMQGSGIQSSSTLFPDSRFFPAAVPHKRAIADETSSSAPRGICKTTLFSRPICLCGGLSVQAQAQAQAGNGSTAGVRFFVPNGVG
jgi:hypothetical protein